MHLILTDLIKVLGWVFGLVVILSGTVTILAWLLNKFTGEINVWREIKRKNTAMAILLAAIVLSICWIMSTICPLR